MPVSPRVYAYLRQNVLGLVAIFIALSGTAYATHPGGTNTISTADIQSRAVTSPKLGLKAVETANIAPSAVTGSKLADDAVSARKLGAEAVGTAKLADGAVTPQKLACAGNSGADKMVRAGGVCIDRYENSIWDAPTGGKRITGAIPCRGDGQDCTDIYARSVAGVLPNGRLTWFQAQQALANSGKRLPTNAEWQQVAAGTPDHPGPCNTNSTGRLSTGQSPGCISNHGAYDMVGNVWEWVADWTPRSNASGNWGSFSDDLQGLAGAASSGAPGALIRGGNYSNVSGAGPLAMLGNIAPGHSASDIGFRGVR
jgi:hypothetical protein